MNCRFAILSLAVFSTSVIAEEYRSFSDVSFSRSKAKFESATYYDPDVGPVSYVYEADTDRYSLDYTYYFGDKGTQGPLKEFEYINKVSNVFGSYTRFDYELGSEADITSIGGEYFANNLVIGGSILNLDDANVYYASLGYLFSPNFKLTLESVNLEGESTEFFLGARYNYQLNGTDYLGFDFRSDDDFETPSVSSKYFKDLGNETYLALNFSFTDTAIDDDLWSVGAEYYFSKSASIGVELAEEDTYGLGFSHFFNRNIFLELAYSSSDGSTGRIFDESQYTVGLNLQL